MQRKDSLTKVSILNRCGGIINSASYISSSNHLFLLRYIKNKDIKYTENFCEALAQKLGARQDIPNECRSYDSVKMILNRREAVRGAAAVAFEVRKDRTYMMHSLQIAYKIQF